MSERDADGVAGEAAGDSVTAEALRADVGGRELREHLADAEQPQFLLRGSILDIVDRTVPESEDGRRSRKVASSGGVLVTLVTDERVLVLIPRPDTAERLDIDLGAVETAEPESAPGGNERLVLQTADKAYHIDTSRSADGETRDASEFLREVRPEPGSEAGADTPLDTLDRLADLHERGALTDEEFAQKKTELLDRI
ncbi:SHOCT domain-containing protein [Halorientalis pallida]|nr:SHOCT domain-containing protein [Halorientalis pallida]